jgi:SsrA-binding protein
VKIIHKNKKAFFDYEILETYKVGVVLTGAEVKSVREGNVNLKGAYVSIAEGEVHVKGMSISHYVHDQSTDYDPLRYRKLLLNKKEIHKLQAALNTQGTTVVPLTVGLEGRLIKMEIGLARGKKKHDKRQTIKERDSKRRLDRLIRRY